MPKSSFSSDVLISLATAPLLAALVGGRAIAKLMQDAGRLSEELFRGDRLPVLRMPVIPHPEDSKED